MGEAEAVCAREANEIFIHYFTSAVTYLGTFWGKKRGRGELVLGPFNGYLGKQTA